MQATRQHHRDTSTEAGAYAAGLSGAQAYQEQEAFGAGAPTYDTAHNVIANNASGGAGYFAEAHHTASLNIDANRQQLGTSAERMGSTAFGSPDIVVDGVQFNPKSYESAQQSYQAGAQLVGEGDAIAAKYAGQTIIVPADQLAQAQRLHAEAIAQAHAAKGQDEQFTDVPFVVDHLGRAGDLGHAGTLNNPSRRRHARPSHAAADSPREG